MIIRQGFVSNSSTSSFLCEISLEAGEYDTSDPVVIECSNGHLFEVGYLADAVRSDVVSEWDTSFQEIGEALFRQDNDGSALSTEDPWETYTAYFKEEYLQDSTTLPAEHCPICKMQQFSYFDMLRYLLALANFRDITELKTYLRGRFRSWDDMHNFFARSSMHESYQAARDTERLITPQGWIV